MARPIPREDPVTSAIFPENSIVYLLAISRSPSPRMVLGLLVVLEQFIDQFASNGHLLLLIMQLLVVQVLTIYTNYYTVSILEKLA